MTVDRLVCTGLEPKRLTLEGVGGERETLAGLLLVEVGPVGGGAKEPGFAQSLEEVGDVGEGVASMRECGENQLTALGVTVRV